MTAICIIGEIGGARRARLQRNIMNTVYQAEPKKVNKMASWQYNHTFLSLIDPHFNYNQCMTVYGGQNVYTSFSEAQRYYLNLDFHSSLFP
jgi:hypothetical protein